MAIWFPAYTVDGREKGGLGFFKCAAHPLMDYLTFALARVTPNIVLAKTDAKLLFDDKSPACEFSDFESIAHQDVGQIDFQVSQNADDQAQSGVLSAAWMSKSRPA